MDNRDLDGLFSRDGLIHPAYPSRETAIKGRRDLWSGDTYRDASVCLTCEADVCEGETKCFRRRMAYLTAAHEEVTLPKGVLLDDLICADEVCGDGGWMNDLPWE